MSIGQMGIYWLSFCCPLAEIAAFVAVALAIGWLWAVCLFLATSHCRASWSCGGRAAATSIASASAFAPGRAAGDPSRKPRPRPHARRDSAGISGLYYRPRWARCCSFRRCGARSGGDRAARAKRAGAQREPVGHRSHARRMAPGFRDKPSQERTRQPRKRREIGIRDPCPASAAVLATPPTGDASSACGTEVAIS